MPPLPPILSLPVLRVLIASPGDQSDFRDVVEEAVLDWTRINSESLNVVAFPLRWEKDTAARTTGALDGQQEINRQLLQRAHILIGIFGSRFGSPTGRFDSGTEEEIVSAINAGLRVHLFFYTGKISLPDVDLPQLQAVRDFETRLRTQGLHRNFCSKDELQIHVLRALSADFRDIYYDEFPSVVSTPVGSSVKASLSSQSQNAKISFFNRGVSQISGFTPTRVFARTGDIAFSPSGASQSIPPGGTVSFTLLHLVDYPEQLQFTASWREQGQLHTETFRF